MLRPVEQPWPGFEDNGLEKYLNCLWHRSLTTASNPLKLGVVEHQRHEKEKLGKSHPEAMFVSKRWGLTNIWKSGITAISALTPKPQLPSPVMFGNEKLALWQFVIPHESRLVLPDSGQCAGKDQGRTENETWLLLLCVCFGRIQSLVNILKVTKNHRGPVLAKMSQVQLLSQAPRAK